MTEEEHREYADEISAKMKKAGRDIIESFRRRKAAAEADDEDNERPLLKDHAEFVAVRKQLAKELFALSDGKTTLGAKIRQHMDDVYKTRQVLNLTCRRSPLQDEMEYIIFIGRGLIFCTTDSRVSHIVGTLVFHHHDADKVCIKDELTSALGTSFSSPVCVSYGTNRAIDCTSWQIRVHL